MSFVKKIASATVLALAMFTLTTFVAAQDDSTNTNPDQTQKERRGGRGDRLRQTRRQRNARRKRGGFGMHGLKQLDLTDAQKEQVRGIMETAKTANEPLRNEMKLLMEKRRGGEELSETDRTRLKELRSQMKQTHEANPEHDSRNSDCRTASETRTDERRTSKTPRRISSASSGIIKRHREKNDRK